MKGLIDFVDAVDLHFDAAVVKKNSASSCDLFREFVVGDRCNGLVATHLLGGQREVITIAKRDWPFFKAA